MILSNFCQKSKVKSQILINNDDDDDDDVILHNMILTNEFESLFLYMEIYKNNHMAGQTSNVSNTWVINHDRKSLEQVNGLYHHKQTHIVQRKQPTRENILKATQVPTIMISHLPLHLHEVSNQCCQACFCGIQKPWFNVSFKSVQSSVPISHFKRRMGFRISLKTRQDTSWGRIGQGRMRQDLCDLLIHRSKQPLGFFVERHPHRMKLGHLLCNLCRNAGVTQLTGV